VAYLHSMSIEFANMHVSYDPTILRFNGIHGDTESSNLFDSISYFNKLLRLTALPSLLGTYEQVFSTLA
jgi:hypothetical protein